MPVRHDFIAHLAQLGLPPAGAPRHPNCLPVYALIGSSSLLRQEALDALRHRLLGQNTAGIAERYLATDSGAIEAALLAARSLPLWAPPQGAPTLVVLHGMGTLSAADSERLSRYFSAPAPHSVLCLVGERLDGRTKFGKALQAKGSVFELAPPRPAELPGWLRQRASQQNLRLDEAAARLIIDCVGADLDLLLQALEQTALYVGEAGVIGTEAVNEALTRTREESIFALTDSLGRRNFSESMLRLEHLLQDGQSPLMVLTMLTRQLRHLLQIKTAGRRASKGDLAARLKVAPFLVDRLIAQAAPFEAAELLAALSAASEADRRLKSSKLSAPLILAKVIAAIC